MSENPDMGHPDWWQSKVGGGDFCFPPIAKDAMDGAPEL